MKVYKIIASVFLFVLLAVSVTAVNLEEYSHKSTITVECDEYKGYARFELPNEYLSLSNKNSYMNTSHSIDLGTSNVYYPQTYDWYVNEIDGYDAIEIESIYDNSYGSVFVSDSNDFMRLDFENPVSKEIDKISIDVKDSSLDFIAVRRGNENLPVTLNKEKFHYELFLEEGVNSDEISLELYFDGTLKIRDVKFYSKKDVSPSFGYFYVDNNCGDTFDLYFGNLGESNAQRGARSLAVVFSTQIDTTENLLYEPDFDSDGILNERDNCIDIPNADQRDIDYNGRGDACQDDDGDRVMNAKDNCIDTYNYNQADDDNDGLGNACDEEDDRFFEKNAALVYVFAGLIGLLFIGVAFVAVKKN